ncbi:HAD family hydrolase [Streptomyces sp. NBC_01218]|uniref:HAD family hydrolase n=1 Tax=unclassified Streptomyces TaxID=2593676 RepID=UPI0023B95546|nr:MULTISPECIES: HAD family hydrolase [unclassified Streptomyces]WEH39577.1 HAD family hydrolase [Streptomyces sp. AM 2-1-1]WSQ51270.1 HAD family hydrolase [Streptomyces sp. NBC_01218]
MRCDAISFDLDETLIDYSVSSVRALEAIGGRPSDLPRWYEASARADREMNRGALPAAEYDDERIGRFHAACHGRSPSASELRDLVDRRRDAVLTHVRLFPDAVRFLASVRAHGITCVAVSNSFAVLREDIVRRLGLETHLTHVTYCGDGVHRKPAKEAFADGLAALGGADAVVHIGDEYEADIVGAGNAGLQGVHVNRSGGRCAHAGTCVTSLDLPLERRENGLHLGAVTGPRQGYRRPAPAAPAESPGRTPRSPAFRPTTHHPEECSS